MYKNLFMRTNEESFKMKMISVTMTIVLNVHQIPGVTPKNNRTNSMLVIITKQCCKHA